MAWNDDSWKDSYDDWKLASPDDDYEEDPCDHDDYETDLLDGRCRCPRCGESWYATAAEIDAQLRFETEYHKAMERENRKQWWSDTLYNVRHPLQAIHWQMQKRGWFRPRATPSDDDIPF
jgi:hypothetical protein